MTPDIPPEVKDALPGVGGSITAAILFFRRGWGMGIALFVLGSVAAYYVGPSVSKIMGNAELAGYTTGAFSMAIITKIFDIISAFDAKQAASDLWEGLLRLLRMKS